MSNQTAEPKRTGIEVAVIGMSGRFPGAGSLDEFWDNLKNGRESISFFSEQELEEVEVPPEIYCAPNYVKAQGILTGIEYFDSTFFAHTPREAELLHPQTRILYQCTWHALEDAGYDPASYKGLIGFYAGGGSSFNWEALAILSGKTGAAESNLTDKDYLCSRISYKLNLKGPVLSVQTACSTSLVAIHLGCRALLTGECKIALAGGVFISTTRKGYLYEDGMILSPDGHCRAFAATAGGTTGGNGAAVVVLKTLKEAIADRDHIYAIVKGSAINNDGIRRVGFTAPSVEGQAEVLRMAYGLARVEPESIGYIETHGTGTTLGDPIEIEALNLVFKTKTKKSCPIGSVKTNVGHLNNAAGAAGFIKTVLALKNKLIPPSLHFEGSNPKVDFENSPFYVNTGLMVWEKGTYPRRAGVSSFGIGGTNAHVILEEAPGEIYKFKPTASRQYQLMVLSAKTSSALENMAQNLLEYFQQHPDINLADAAFTLQVGRRLLPHRRMTVCANLPEAIAALSRPGDGATRMSRAEVEDRPVVFLFPGQGAQYVDMGKELYEKEEVFRHHMDRCFEILNTLVDYDIKEILYPYSDSRGGTPDLPGPNKINQTEITQPVLFIFEYALAKLLMKWGIEPKAMMGHSIGEYTAACLAGVFSLKDALQLVAFRGQSMQQLPTGAMLSVSLAKEELTPLIAAHPEISLAAVNSSSRCVVSGPHQVIRDFARQLEESGNQCSQLHTSHAFHSAMMEPMMESFTQKVRQVKINPPTIPYISNVTGKRITESDLRQPGYWSTHLRTTVQFSAGLEELLKIEKAVLVEVGPGKTLNTLVTQQKARTGNHFTLNLIRHPKDRTTDMHYLLNKLGQLWLYGVNIDWSSFYASESRCRVPLPPYPFEKQRFSSQGDPFRLNMAGMPIMSRPQKRENIADWFYIPSWKRAEWGTSHIAPSAIPTGILVFIAADEFDTRLVKELESLHSQGQVVTVKPGNRFKKDSDTRFTIHPKIPADYVQLLEQLQTSGKTPSLIIHLWNYTGHPMKGENDNRCTEMADDQAIEHALDMGFYSLLYIARAIGSRNIIADMQMKILCSSAFEVNGEEILNPLKAVLLGPVKVIPLEYPNIRCQVIDIPLFPGEKQEQKRLVNQILTECLKTPESLSIIENVTAFRGNYRWVQHVEARRWEQNQNRLSRLKSKGVVLIFGGLGGIGLSLAEFLAKQVQARLILVGRSDFPARQEWDKRLAAHDPGDPVCARILKIQEMETQGAEVLIAAADAADFQQVKSVIDMAVNRFGSINGIIHAAGIADNGGVIQKRSQENSQAVLAAKVKGTLVLDKILQHQPLDFFILCSSLAAPLGSFGQVAYCAANAFLDAFAYYKNFLNPSPGGVTVSIDWDTWQEVGMAVDSYKSVSKDKNPDPQVPVDLKLGILPSEGIEVFKRILDHPQPQVMISTRDLPARIQMAQPNEPSAETTGTIPPAETKTDTAALLQRPELTTPYTAPRDQLEQALAHIWQHYFGFDSIGIHDDFFELGGDSLLGMKLVNQYKKLLGEIVHITVIFDAPTIAQLADYFKTHYPRAVAGLTETGYEETKPTITIEEGITVEKIEQLRRLLANLTPGERHEVESRHSPKNPPAIFILSPPRCGSTLLRVILAGHSRLFAPPELVLLSSNTLDENANGHQSCIRAIMEIKKCSLREATQLLQELETQRTPIKDFYYLLQDWLGDRILVDKSPSYSFDIRVLKRAEAFFENPLYIHLLRHPYGMIHSFEEARMDLLMGNRVLQELSVSRRELAEMIWTISNRNILEFLKDIPEERRYLLKFEDLLSQPHTIVEKLCRFMGVELQPDMLEPYKEKKQRMTDGVHSEGMMFGDVKFHHHKHIEPAVAETWKKNYTSDFLGDITQKLAKKYEYQMIREDIYTSIEPVEEKEYYPLSSAQKRLYIVQQLDLENTGYHVTQAFTLDGVLNKQKVEHTIRKLIQHHQSLRTSFEILEGQPVQRIYSEVSFAVQYDSLTGKPGREKKVVNQFVRAFDLSQPPLLRVGVLEGKDISIFMVDTHHIIADGTSQKILIQEFLMLYADGELQPLKLQYKDFSQWQNRELPGRTIKQQETYWLKEFEGELPELNLPTDYPRPGIQRFEGAFLRFTIGEEETRALKEAALEHGTTLYMVLLAIYTIFLAKICHQECIVVGTPTAGRKHADLERVIGMFVNVLTLKNNVKPDLRFDEFLDEVKKRTLLAYNNQDYQFEELVLKLGGDRSQGRNLIVETHFAFHTGSIDQIGFNDLLAQQVKQLDQTDDAMLKSTPYELERNSTKLDISLVASGRGSVITCDLQYSTILFKLETIEKFSRYLVSVARATAENPQVLIGEISLLSEEEKDKIAADNTGSSDIVSDLKGADFNEIF